jgi:L-idonate 5-dehydrogenase
MRLGEEEPLELNGDSIEIRVRSVGICGSDIHYFMHGRCGNFVPKTPLSLGHEFSGVVVRAPQNDKGIVPGKKVSVNPLLSCGQCDDCLKDQRNLCPEKKYMGSAAAHPHVQGALREIIHAPIDNVHLMPDGMSHLEGAMLEPLSVAMHAVHRAGNLEKKRVCVSGGGTIGQLVLLYAQHKGAIVDLVDPKPYCREIAKNAGANAVIDPLSHSNTNTVECVYDIIFEASGAIPAMMNALNSIKRGGTLVQIGTFGTDLSIPNNLIMTKEINLCGSLQYSGEYEQALKLIAQKVLDCRPLVTHEFSFKDAAEAIRFAAGQSDSIKVQVTL